MRVALKPIVQTCLYLYIHARGTYNFLWGIFKWLFQPRVKVKCKKSSSANGKVSAANKQMSANAAENAWQSASWNLGCGVPGAGHLSFAMYR